MIKTRADIASGVSLTLQLGVTEDIPAQRRVADAAAVRRKNVGHQTFGLSMLLPRGHATTVQPATLFIKNTIKKNMFYMSHRAQINPLNNLIINSPPASVGTFVCELSGWNNLIYCFLL